LGWRVGVHLDSTRKETTRKDPDGGNLGRRKDRKTRRKIEERKPRGGQWGEWAGMGKEWGKLVPRSVVGKGKNERNIGEGKGL